MEAHAIATTLGVLVAAELALKRLAQKELPVLTAYKVAKVCQALAAETAFYHETHRALVLELGAKDTEGNVTVLPENLDAFAERLREVADVPVTLNCAPIDLSTLDGKVEMTAADLAMLGPLVTVMESRFAPSDPAGEATPTA